MDTRLVVLKLFLDELGVPSDIGTVEDRKRVQKAVYLGQLAGVDLGYRFGWYLMGPYCSTLTQDYYSLAEGLSMGENDHDGKTLLPNIRQLLHKIRPVMDVPTDTNLSQEDWLELVASLHYLLKVSRFDHATASETIRKTKPHLSEHIDQALAVMRSCHELA